MPGGLAMDVNRGPLARAEEHIRQEGLSDRIGVRLSDGLEKLSPEETDTVVIAGMGGELICRILREGVRFLKAGRELILQPQSEWFKVRRLLHEYSYRIGREWFLKEDGKYYVVIKAEPAPEGETEQYPDAFTYQYGSCLLAKRDPVLLEYLQKEMEKKQQILEHMAAFSTDGGREPGGETEGTLPASWKKRWRRSGSICRKAAHDIGCKEEVKETKEETGREEHIEKTVSCKDEDPVARPEAVVQGKTYRITVLTPWLLRLEYNEKRHI